LLEGLLESLVKSLVKVLVKSLVKVLVKVLVKGPLKVLGPRSTCLRLRNPNLVTAAAAIKTTLRP
jgi:hypothetical protein